MNIVQKVVRHVHVPWYALVLLWETLRAWGFRKWISFWCSRRDSIELSMDGLTLTSEPPASSPR
jgi:hypothetical protein